MPIHDSLKLKGDLEVVLRSEDGQVKASRVVRNLVVNAGVAFVISRMVGVAKPVMGFMALGASNQAPAASDTSLMQQLGSREAIDSAVIAGSNGEKVVYTCTFEAGDATGLLAEAGVFNASTGGDMLCRTVFDPINKLASDSISIAWTVTLQGDTPGGAP
jgi:hypothetical protein